MADSSALQRIQASVLDEYTNKGVLEDFVFRHREMTSIAAGLIVKKQGNKDFFTQMSLARNPNYQGFGIGDTWKIKNFKGYPKAQWQMKEHVITVPLSEQEKAYGDSGLQLFDITKHVVTTTEKSLSDNLADDFILSDGTGDDGKRGMGLEVIVGDKSSPWPIVGGLDTREHPWWQSIIKRPEISFPEIDLADPTTPWTYGTDTNSVTNPFNSADTVPWQLLTLDMVDEYIDLARKVGPGPKFCLTTTEIIRRMLKLIRAEAGEASLVRVQGSTLYAGHEHVVYRDVTFMQDRAVKRGDMYWLTGEGDSLAIRVLPSHWMKNLPWQRPVDQGVDYSAIYAWWQMYSQNRRNLGKFIRVAHK